MLIRFTTLELSSESEGFSAAGPEKVLIKVILDSLSCLGFASSSPGEVVSSSGDVDIVAALVDDLPDVVVSGEVVVEMGSEEEISDFVVDVVGTEVIDELSSTFTGVVTGSDAELVLLVFGFVIDSVDP